MISVMRGLLGGVSALSRRAMAGCAVHYLARGLCPALADWKSALERGKQITSIQWQFNYYGPYVDDVIDTARSDPRFEIVQTRNYYGEPKEIIRVREGVEDPLLDEEEKAILDFIIEKTCRKTWSDFISLVYSTYPIITQLRFSELDLVKLAQEYKRLMPSLHNIPQAI